MQWACKHFRKGIRWINLLMILMLYGILLWRFPQIGAGNEIWWLVAAALLITAGGNLENDWHDRHVDPHNRKFNLYAHQEHCSAAWPYLIYALGLASAAVFLYLRGYSLYYLTVFAAVVILLMLYNRSIKKMPLIGNVIVSSLVVFLIFTVILFYPVPLKVQKKLLFIAIWLFLVTLNREIIKDFQDRKGDRRARFQTLPILSPRRAFQLLYFNILLSWLTWLAYISSIHLATAVKIYYGLLLLYMSAVTWYYSTKKWRFATLASHYKVILFLGMIGILFI